MSTAATLMQRKRKRKTSTHRQAVRTRMDVERGELFLHCPRVLRSRVLKIFRSRLVCLSALIVLLLERMAGVLLILRPSTSIQVALIGSGESISAAGTACCSSTKKAAQSLVFRKRAALPAGPFAPLHAWNGSLSVGFRRDRTLALATYRDRGRHRRRGRLPTCCVSHGHGF